MAKSPMTFDRPLAWVCETYEDENGITQVRVIREGMNREEIVKHFPPPRTDSNLDFCRQDLVKAIIFEAHEEALAGARRDRGNIRSFWYERIMYTLLTVMGEPGDSANIDSINMTINLAWRDLIEDGHVTYRALGLYSEKEGQYLMRVVEDSPYPSVIVMVEKASLYEDLNDLASIYEISFCCAGGQSSRAAAMAYTYELEKKGIDLGRDFTVFSFCDYDPEGWVIPEAFISQLQLRITGQIDLIRLGVLRGQIGDSVIKYQAVPYPIEARSDRAKKGKQTKYDHFEEATGGLFIPGPRGELIPAKVELDIYTGRQIRDRIITGLCQHLEGFEYQVRPLKEAIKTGFSKAWERVGEDLRDEIGEVYQPYYGAIEEAIDGLQEDKANRTLEEEKRLRELYREVATLNYQKEQKTADLTAAISRLEDLRHDVERQQEAEYMGIWADANADKNPVDLAQEIENNGGWRGWFDELGMDDCLGTDDLIRFGQRHQRVSWQPSWDDRDKITDWVSDNAGMGWYGDPQGPDKTPEELIEGALNHDSDD